MRRLILPLACISNSWLCNNLNVIITFVMFRLRITRPGGRCMCKLQAGVRGGEQEAGEECRDCCGHPAARHIVVIHSNYPQHRGKYCAEQYSWQSDGSGPKYLRTWENIRNTRRVGYLTNDSGLGWNVTLEPWSRAVLVTAHCTRISASGKNHKPILAKIIGYQGANWALNIICMNC